MAEVEHAFPWFFPLCVFVFGAMIGSFLNVVIYRVPAGKSIVSPGSHCACGQPIKWYHNLPILSWIILRGRARCCNQPYSVRYPLVELLTAVLFLTVWLRLPPDAALGGLILVSLLIAATFIDLDHMIIPDSITIGGVVVAVVLSFCLPAIHGHMDAEIYLLGSIRSGFASIVGVFVGSGLILWIALLAESLLKKEAMGFGDVKFMGLIGGFLGWKGAVFTVFGGAIVGTFWFIAALILKKLWGASKTAILPAETPEGEATEVALGTHVPFGPMLAIAGTIYLLLAKPYFELYLNDILTLWATRS
jgi:leader peptidase (prepilin peptidase)/N-methyltransferase